MSANEPKALFILNNNNNNNNNNNSNYEEDPTVIRARENLALAEKVQQEWLEQKRLERAQLQAEVEAERLWRKVEEVEKEWRGLEEVELKQQWSRWSRGGKRVGTLSWGPRLLRPYGLSTLAWAPLRVNLSQVGRLCQRVCSFYIGP